jgi:hypothetical protein
MAGQMDFTSENNFIEEEYLEMYPDVRAAIGRGLLSSGHDHYVKYGRAEGRRGVKLSSFEKIKEFPDVLMSRIKIKYPHDMEMPFEEWYFDNYSEKQDKTERAYLPIFWTGYHVNSDFGQNRSKIDFLQDFINGLDRGKKYYTILNYDDGCLIDFKDLDIIVYTASGKGGVGTKCINYHIPLLTSPHKEVDTTKKDILCSFVGRFDTHSVREKLRELYGKNDKFYLKNFTSLDEFVDITARSKFVIAPRGYGLASFRMYEALQYGSIPIYISDYHVIPFAREDFFVKVFDYQINKLDKVLNPLFNDQKFQADMVKKVNSFYKEYCTYESLKKQILKNVKYGQD